MDNVDIQNALSAQDIESKLAEFSNDLNSNLRISMLSVDEEEKQRLKYLLLTLKRNIQDILVDLEACPKENYNFLCGLCNECIPTDRGRNIWDSLQEHDHFEQLYVDFLTGNLKVESQSEITMTSDSNTDSGIEQQENEPSTSGDSIRENVTEDVNNFRFNFRLNYNEEVENRIYPPTLMSHVRKYDRVREFTIQRAGPLRASCLICPCEMNGMRVSKFVLVNHAMGQRHLRAVSNPVLLEALQSYHEYWLKEDAPVQAHQVYFRPESKFKLKCLLCISYVKSDDIRSHIMGDVHKTKVLDLFEKRSNLYFLVDLQVQIYGLMHEQMEDKNKEIKTERKFAVPRRKPKNVSESDMVDEHTIIKAVDNISATDPLELLPNRLRNELQFLQRIKNGVKSSIECSLCACNLPDELTDLKNHLATAELHINKRKKRYNYYCEICNVHVTSERNWMQHNFSGPRHTNMAESRKARVREYECTTCNTVIFGDELSMLRHLAVKPKGKKKEGIALPESVKVMFKSKDHILSEANRLVAEGNDVLSNNLMTQCCSELECALREVFEECRVYPFGSRISGIGNKDSDLDVFVDIGKMYLGLQLQDPPDQVQIIRRAARAFKNSKNYTNIVQVSTARTPILKLVHVPTKIACDLSFRHGLSVENTKYLKLCLQLQPVAHQCLVLFKKWAGFMAFENITTYALAIMAIFYLQTKQYLLPVETLRRMSKGEPLVISGWKTITTSPPLDELKKSVQIYPNTVDVLLKELFTYYGKFDFNTYVVCPLLGRVVKKSQFVEDNGRQLPAEMEPYLQQLKNEDYEVFRSNSLMCIQDPFDLSHNLTKAAQRGTVNKFQTMCTLTLKFLQSVNA